MVALSIMKMGVRLPKPWVALALVGVVGLGVSSSGRRTTLGFRNSVQKALIEAGDWMAWGTPESQQVALLDQFRDDLATALTFNRSSAHLQDWHQAGYLPSDIFHSVREMVRIEKKTRSKPKAARKFCRALGELPDSGLALFQVAIEESQDLLPCKETLLSRLDAYWQDRAQKITYYIDSRPIGDDEAEIQVDVGRTQRIGQQDIPSGHWVLSFSGGLHSTRTRRILSALRDQKWPANFFFTGERVTFQSDLVRATRDAGHIVGTESLRNESLKHATLREASRSIGKGIEKVGRPLGIQPLLFRFPYGLSTPDLENFVAESGLRNMDWTLDSRDWQIRDPEELRRSLVREMTTRDSGVVLLHDNLEQTALALPAVLADLREQGIRPAIVIPKSASDIAAY